MQSPMVEQYNPKKSMLLSNLMKNNEVSRVEQKSSRQSANISTNMTLKQMRDLKDNIVSSKQDPS